MAGRRVLEVGLGYGTVAERLARAGADYHGLDIATGPVEMARHRLAGIPNARPEQVQQGSVLELQFPDASFDRVVSIGCLHHTGDLARAVAEVRRVLRPGGELLLMVYNRHSARRVLLWPLLAARYRLVAGAPTPEAWLRYASDGTPSGDAPPHTDFVSSAELRDVRIDRRNIDRVPLGPLEISRVRLMRLGVDRLVGLDLYATARA
jgi:SAM-dependent methyltransferase